ncbi:E3 ubiquitin protein ligase DRIP2-like [Miscanthus floridulus]|uniref:E3 ubiquitin protein ligase DRIP2-like n=1 Tax=Miscanthus floridulus TaxID=154761 RepID=UPI003458B2C2
MESAVLVCEAPTAGASAHAAAAPGAGGDGGAGDVVMLRRSALVACLTCPLCGRLFRDAATITECLHTFCRKCISEEFINKEVCCCPICSIDLGCAPLEKLRIDHSLQYVRSKVFPLKKQKVEGPEVTSPITSPIKTKERSLSSLTKHTPQMSMQKCLTKRRTKASCLRKLPLHSTFRGSSNITKKSGGWRPLGCHFRAAKNKRSLRSKSEDVMTAEKKTDDPVDVTLASQAKTKKQFTRRGNLEKRTGTKKLLILKGKQKNTKPKNMPNKRRLQALWFYLLAAFDQKGQPPLPQIPSKFLRIKDVNLPASFIQKYLVQKLNLPSEAEVEILCGGRPVNPGIPLHDLADYWIDKRPKGRVRSSVGTPAAEFVLKVFYARSGAPLPEIENNKD